MKSNALKHLSVIYLVLIEISVGWKTKCLFKIRVFKKVIYNKRKKRIKEIKKIQHLRSTEIKTFFLRKYLKFSTGQREYSQNIMQVYLILKEQSKKFHINYKRINEFSFHFWV